MRCAARCFWSRRRRSAPAVELLSDATRSRRSSLLRPRGVGENALPGCADESAQLLVGYARKPDQHERVAQVMVRDIVGFRIFGEESRALFEIGAEDKRTWLRRPVRRETRHQALTEPERRGTIHGAFLEVREVAPDRAHRVETGRWLRHPRLIIWRACQRDNCRLNELCGEDSIKSPSPVMVGL